MLYGRQITSQTCYPDGYFWPDNETGQLKTGRIMKPRAVRLIIRTDFTGQIKKLAEKSETSFQLFCYPIDRITWPKWMIEKIVDSLSLTYFFSRKKDITNVYSIDTSSIGG